MRSFIRKESRISSNVWTSLQDCTLSENRSILSEWIKSFRDKPRIQNLCALRYILDTLMAGIGDSKTVAYVTLHEVVDIYVSFKKDLLLQRNSIRLEPQNNGWNSCFSTKSMAFMSKLLTLTKTLLLFCGLMMWFWIKYYVFQGHIRRNWTKVSYSNG